MSGKVKLNDIGNHARSWCGVRGGHIVEKY